MRCGGREDVAAVKRARDVLERVRRVRELVRGLDPRPLGRRQQEAVVRPDVEPPLLVTQRERPPGGADSGVDHREMHADGEVRERVREHERALQHLLRRDAMRDVDDLRLRRDPLDHAVARADEVVLKPEVAQEGDEHAREVTAATRPATSCVSASPDDAQAACERRCGRLRADADRGQVDARAGRRRAPRTQTRAERGLPRAERPGRAHACGRAAGSPPRAPPRADAVRPRLPRRARGRRAVAARRAGPPASRRRERGPRRRARPPWPRRSRRPVPGAPVSRRRSSRAPFTLVTTSQS